MAEYALELSELSEIRRAWHKGEWYYHVVDVVVYLTEKRPGYWYNLKKDLIQHEGLDEALIEQVRMPGRDGRLRPADMMNEQNILRLLQSIPSPKVEPFRMWLARVGQERLEEIEHPEKALDRYRAKYRAEGRPEEWIEERLKSDLIRNELTDEWRERGAKEDIHFAILTNELSEGTFELTVKAYKEYKQLPAKANVRDHMTNIELALTSLSEATSIEFHRDRNSQGFGELRRDAKDAGRVAGQARKVVEEALGRSVVSPENFLKAPKQRKQIEQPKMFEE